MGHLPDGLGVADRCHQHACDVFAVAQGHGLVARVGKAHRQPTGDPVEEPVDVVPLVRKLPIYVLGSIIVVQYIFIFSLFDLNLCGIYGE